ncbi:MAG: hypothetical protein M1829_005395 [Trizodia sp. TS-e1964]|nr:MAG: hypothetical protein M1829_005395 [Trizodia sp. TS-e1964]
MLFTHLLPVAALAAGAAAQSLIDVLHGSPNLSSLTSYINAFPDIVNALSSASNITVLAPSNDAFTKFLAGGNASLPINSTVSPESVVQAVLTYHVLTGSYPSSAFSQKPLFIPSLLRDPGYANVTGGQVVEAVNSNGSVSFISGVLARSGVVTADVKFNGGVVHIIDTVLTVPESIALTATAANLTALAGALTTANLVGQLQSLKDVTVFAPTNAAFAAVGSAVANLTIDQLVSILGYHVVQGTVGYSTLLTNGQTLKTVQGGNVVITVAGNGDIYVDSAKVVLPNVLVANGVVHVIDNVLNPNATNATPVTTASTQSVAYSGASSVTSMPFTSGIATPSTTLAGATTSSSTAVSGAAAPMRTGAMGAAALFGAGAAFMNM